MFNKRDRLEELTLQQRQLFLKKKRLISERDSQTPLNVSRREILQNEINKISLELQKINTEIAELFQGEVFCA